MAVVAVVAVAAVMVAVLIVLAVRALPATSVIDKALDDGIGGFSVSGGENRSIRRKRRG